MKVLLINGSPHKKGNTFLALQEIAKTLQEQGIEADIAHIGTKAIQGCIACGKCAELGHCVFNDEVYASILKKAEEADGLIVGSPVYFAGPNGSLCALLDRLFYSGKRHFVYKPAAAIAVCRRGGASAAFDRLNKYFTISNMPVVPSQYWNIAHGKVAGDVLQDLEGLQTMRTLAKNMAWLLSLQKDGAQHPEIEPVIRTDFIR